LLVNLIESVYRLLWGDLFTIPLGGGIGISFMVVLLFTAGIWFTCRTRLLPVRLFRDMIAAVCEKKQGRDGLSSFQTLVISTATRVGMGNLVGVVAAVSAGGAGAVFWMWVTAILGASTSFIESTLAQKYRQPDPLYGGWRGGPAYYLHVLAERRRGKKLKRSVVAALFAVSGLICWCGISQVISNSVSSAFENAFHIPPLTTTLVLTAIAAVIVLRKNATVKSLDVMVPIMAVCYFVITVGIVLFNLPKLPAVFGRIFAEASGLRQAVAGGFGAVLMNGVKRGLFSNEAGSGSAPCAAAAAECDDPVKMGFVQALGVLIDTVVICSCTAFLMLLVPQEITEGLAGMDFLQTALQYHLGGFGVVFIAATLALFSFSTFLGVLYYARGNVAYLCGDNWWSQTVYKLIALVMLVIGGMQAYTVVWDLGDVGIGLMTIFNMIALVPMAKEALAALNDYEKRKKLQ
jgi:AGCS family alanine or glycine:cation symporter